MLRIALVAATLGLAGCAAASSPGAPANRTESAPAANTQSGAGQGAAVANRIDPNLPQRDRDCLARGGQPGKAGITADWVCVTPRPDAGKACTGSSECDGDCIYAPKPGEPRPQPGDPVAGICQATSNDYGCRDQVEEGRFVGTLCVD